MLKKTAVVLGVLAAIFLLGAAVYYFQLTAPIQVSNKPPAAPTLAAGTTSIPSGTGIPSVETVAQVYRIDPTQSEALYRVDETFFDVRGFVIVTGTTNGVAGDILVDSQNPANSRIGEIVVDISQLRTNEPDRDNAIRRGYLESSTYPLATFRNATVSGLPTKWEEGKTIPVKIEGDMTVRDNTERVTWDGKVVLDSQTFRGKATTALKMSQFGIDPPNLSMLKVEDDIVLTLNFVAIATGETNSSGPGATKETSCTPSRQGPTTTSPIDDAPVRSSVGKGHVLNGTVKSSLNCAPISGAKIIFWLANPAGQYDDDHRASVFTDASGVYTFESNFPGLYTTRPHIHLYVQAPGHKAIEQEYFPGTGQTEGTFDVVLAPDESAGANLTPSMPTAVPESCEPTFADPPGPYVPDAPVRQSVGKGHIVRGTVKSSRDCSPISGAMIEMWPSDENDDHDYDARATLFSDREGEYSFESNFPNHIHMRVSALGYETIFTNAYHPKKGDAEGRFDIVLRSVP